MNKIQDLNDIFNEIEAAARSEAEAYKERLHNDPAFAAAEHARLEAEHARWEAEQQRMRDAGIIVEGSDDEDEEDEDEEDEDE